MPHRGVRQSASLLIPSELLLLRVKPIVFGTPDDPAAQPKEKHQDGVENREYEFPAEHVKLEGEGLHEVDRAEANTSDGEKNADSSLARFGPTPEKGT